MQGPSGRSPVFPWHDGVGADGASGPGERCPLCAGQWIDGRSPSPIVGSLRFVYRLGTNEVATEVAARICKDCGHVEL